MIANAGLDLKARGRNSSSKDSRAHSIEVKSRLGPRTLLLKPYATLLTTMILLWFAVVASENASGTAVPAGGSSASQENTSRANPSPSSPIQSGPSQLKSGPTVQQEAQLPSQAGISGYEGKVVQSIEIPGAAERDREHILQLLPQKVGEPLDRGRVRESIRTLYATGPPRRRPCNGPRRLCRCSGEGRDPRNAGRGFWKPAAAHRPGDRCRSGKSPGSRSASGRPPGRLPQSGSRPCRQTPAIPHRIASISRMATPTGRPYLLRRR